MESRTADVKARRWFQRWSASDRRKAKREQVLGLVAYYWDGAAPGAHKVREISSTGLYLQTDQCWYPGTLVTMTLQRTGISEAGAQRSIAVQTKVVRQGMDGAAFAFIMPQSRKSSAAQYGGNPAADQKALEVFLRNIIGAEKRMR